MLENDAMAIEAQKIANEIESIIIGRPSAAVMYGIGMVIASGVAQSKARSIEATMEALRAVVEDELDRQFTN